MPEKKNKLKNIEPWIDDIYRCFRCGLCRSVCPSFEESGLESSSPRGRVQYARAALEDSIALDSMFEDRILDCLSCRRCVEICPSGVRTDQIVMAARAELVERGRLNPIKKILFNGFLKHAGLMSTGARAGSLGQRLFMETGSSLAEVMPWLAGMEDKKIPVLSDDQAMNRLPVVNPVIYGSKILRVGYFIGCATNFIFPHIAEATVRVLTRNRVEVVIPRGQVCCGIPVYSSGDFENARKLAEKNLNIFRGHDLDCIVTDCASCSAALKHDITELLGMKGFEVPVYDLNEFLATILEIDRNFAAVDMTVTYHDPCHLVRGQGISAEPRELLTMVPGVELVEMNDADTCCGGAGAFSYTHHTLSRKIGRHKVENIRATGADYVATPCPSCKMQIDDLLHHEGIAVKTIHPIEVLDMSYRKKDIEDNEILILDA